MHHCHRLWSFRGLSLKQFVDALISGECGRCVIPLHQQLLAFGFGQQGQFGQACFWMSDNAFEKCLKMADQACDSRSFEQVSGVFHPACQSMRGFRQFEGKVELGSASIYR